MKKRRMFLVLALVLILTALAVPAAGAQTSGSGEAAGQTYLGCFSSYWPDIPDCKKIGAEYWTMEKVGGSCSCYGDEEAPCTWFRVNKSVTEDCSGPFEEIGPFAGD